MKNEMPTSNKPFPFKEEAVLYQHETDTTTITAILGHYTSGKSNGEQAVQFTKHTHMKTGFQKYGGFMAHPSIALDMAQAIVKAQTAFKPVAVNTPRKPVK